MVRFRFSRGFLLVLCLLVSGFVRGATLFDDDFNGTQLDLTKWVVLGGGTGISVGGGNVSFAGGPDHKRINSLTQFTPPAGGAVTATALMYINGDYQKFGFNVNSIEFAGPTVGFYFDAFETADQMDLVVWPVPPATGARVVQTIALPWGHWYELAVRWTPTDVTFFVDGVMRWQYAYAWTGPLPIGIWNDRPPLMQADWVRVESSVPDADNDGVPDTSDSCPSSILTPTVVIDGCDSGVANTVGPDGCTLADKIASCAAAARNHGDYVSCVVHITASPAIRRCAAQADIP